jgi:hypothetical protein
LKTGAILAVTLQQADQGDTTTVLGVCPRISVRSAEFA